MTDKHAKELFDATQNVLEWFERVHGRGFTPPQEITELHDIAQHFALVEFVREEQSKELGVVNDAETGKPSRVYSRGGLLCR